MKIRRDDLRTLLLIDGFWFILLIEHFCFKLELAHELACVWGIWAVIVTVRTLWKYPLVKINK